jgi:hypothetical protein
MNALQRFGDWDFAKGIRPDGCAHLLAGGRRSEVLAFAQLINLAEGKKVI